METNSLHLAVNNYIRDNLSPKPEQRDYITEKYAELKDFLGDSLFRTGSYARYTAINPVHDLDVIYPVHDSAIQQNPSSLMVQLKSKLTQLYKNSPTQVKRIYAQTHSITIELADSPEGDFSIDVVPAVELSEKNNYNQPLYIVPEIQRINHKKREQRYANQASKPIGWVKTDPRGYVEAARILNERNSDFRHTAKLLKGWRHACKAVHKDNFKLKSFHLEQIVGKHFEVYPNSNTVEAAVSVLKTLPTYLTKQQIPDRADPSKYIDSYVKDLSDEELSLIIRLQANAQKTISELVDCDNVAEVNNKLRQLTSVTRAPVATPLVARTVTPRQPWAF